MEQKRLKKLYYFFEPLYFDPSKWNLFREYLHSPLHINSPTKAELLDQVHQFLELPGEIAEQKLAATAFPDKDASEPTTVSHLRRNLSSLLEHYYEFEALLAYQKDDAMKWRYALKVANELKWDAYFPWLYQKKVRKSLETLPKDENYFGHRIDIAHQRDQFLNRSAKDQSEIRDRYRDEADSLIHLASIRLLKLACNLSILRRQKDDSEGYEIPMLEQLLQIVESNWKSQEILTRIYFLIHKNLNGPYSETEMARLRNLIYEKSIEQGEEEARHLLHHVINLHTNAYNSFQTSNKELSLQILIELKRLYEFALDNRLIFHRVGNQKFIGHRDFKNIVVLFSKGGMTEWAARFIQTYKDSLLKDLQGTVYNFNLGIVLFFKGEFETAYKKLYEACSQIKVSEDKYYFISAHIYYLRCIFELGWYADCSREAYNTINALKRIKSLPKPDKEKAIQFCKHLRKLCKSATDSPDKKTIGLEKLEVQLQNSNPTLSLSWLQEKAREIKS